MNQPVDRITVHHAGDGPPTDDAWSNSDVYCVRIGVTRFTVVQPPWTATATKGFNYVSWDIVLSGNRMIYPVTDNDLHLLTAACSYARSHGWLAVGATTFPHGTLHPPPPGYPTGSSSTDCPGTLTIGRWPAVVSACASTPIPAPGDDDVPADNDIVSAYANSEGAWELEYGGGVRTVRGPFFGSYFTLPASVRNDPARRFRAICAPMDTNPRGYALVSVKGETYNFHTPQ
jgi:hypothetical protein